MRKRRLSRDEVAKLSYYDLMGYLGASAIHWGGVKATEALIGMCHITRDKGIRVLDVGCGSGFSACRIAKKY